MGKEEISHCEAMSQPAKEDKEFETEYRNAYGDMDFERVARVLSARLRQMDKRSKAANIRADKAEARNAELVKALEFYAARGNWQDDIALDPAGTPVPYTSPIAMDYGDRARAVLGGQSNE